MCTLFIRFSAGYQHRRCLIGICKASNRWLTTKIDGTRNPREAHAAQALSLWAAWSCFRYEYLDIVYVILKLMYQVRTLPWREHTLDFEK